jgi:hypothetical protein
MKKILKRSDMKFPKGMDHSHIFCIWASTIREFLYLENYLIVIFDQ